jgi:hypothetical protein
MQPYNEIISNILGYIGVGIWLYKNPLQVIKCYKCKSVEGLSLISIYTNAIADMIKLTDVYININILYLNIQVLVVVCLDLCLVIEFILYSRTIKYTTTLLVFSIMILNCIVQYNYNINVILRHTYLIAVELLWFGSSCFQIYKIHITENSVLSYSTVALTYCNRVLKNISLNLIDIDIIYRSNAIISLLASSAMLYHLNTKPTYYNICTIGIINFILIKWYVNVTNIYCVIIPILQIIIYICIYYYSRYNQYMLYTVTI